MDDRVSSALWFRQVLAAVTAAGLDGPALCRRAGLDPEALNSAHARLPNAVISRIWELAIEESGNPAIALVAPHAFQPAAFDAMGYAMMSSADLRGALERAVRYAAVITNATTARVTPLNVGARFEIFVRAGDRPPPVQGYEFVLLTLLSFLRWMAGQELTPLAVEFKHPAPVDLQAHQLAFRCPLRFGAPAYALVFSRADLARPLQTANPWLAEMHDQLMTERMRRFAQGVSAQADLPVAPRVCSLLVQALPDGEPTRASVAKALGLGERTLQRRLQAESTTFQVLLERTRRELAERYLNSDQVALVELACLLGFSSQAALTKACRRWFGVPPRQLRQQSRQLRG